MKSKAYVEQIATPEASGIPVYCKFDRLAPPETLKPHPDNAHRTHPPKQLDAYERVIQGNGWRKAVVVSRRSGFIVKGHGAWMTASRRGWEIPIELQPYASLAEERRDLVADNRLAQGALNDDAKLALLLSEFDEGGLALTGYDEAEVSKLLAEINQSTSAADAEPQINKAAELAAKWGVKPGQIWELGVHRLMCGDCTVRSNVEHLTDEKPTLCLTDPPYGLGAGKESEKNNYGKYKDTKSNLIELAKGWLPIARSICKAVVFSPGVTNAWIYPEADWVMCWFYGGGQLRSSWGFNCWQPFLCYGKDPSLASGNGGRPDAIDMNTPANAGDIDHPCPKPLKLWVWFIERLSFSRDDAVYDPFSGSGTTIIACEQLGRKCRAMEIDPGYVAVAIQRWADATGGMPRLVTAPA